MGTLDRAEHDRPRATLASVAALAQVSPQTVSNVLNAPHLVRADTTARVREAIDELGYRPLAAARQMRTRRSRIIGLRLEPLRDGINGVVLDRFLHALTEEAQSGGYRVMLFTAHDDADEIAQYGELLVTTSIDGFVLTGTHHDDPRTTWLTERAVPFVAFGRPWSDDPRAARGHSWVDVDGASGTRAATEHLLAEGHRRVGYLGWPAGKGVADDRRRGWREAVDQHLGDLRAAADAWEIRSEDGVAAGISGARALLGRPNPPTALVCASDSLAIGAAAAGGGLTVIGFDDTPAAAAMGISSVAQPLVEAARNCFALLHERLDAPDGAPPPTAQRLLAPDLVLRAGTPPA
ncbi:LacI family DNA-binding transcriptional regulator [Actinokineospora guangxiensis]|uniref:LacI family DNA-binding transcriptional regulator n=1 Tax=Actinokineospora guangxiensis TaxID=1490288 RepID=A0ABW0EYF3_9PSEU